MNQRTDGQLDAELIELRDSFVWHANAAVLAGRDDLARSLGQEYPTEVLALRRRRS